MEFLHLLDADSEEVQLAIKPQLLPSRNLPVDFKMFAVVLFLPTMHLDIHHSWQQEKAKMNQTPTGNKHVTS